MATSLYSCDICQHNFVGEALAALHIPICHPEVNIQCWAGSTTEASNYIGCTLKMIDVTIYQQSGYHSLDDTFDLSSASYKVRLYIGRTFSRILSE